MAKVELNTKKMLGFRLLDDADQTSLISAKTGAKDGIKVKPVLGAKIGDKIGIKVGIKV